MGVPLTVGQKLRLVRQVLHYTQLEMAQALGMGYDAYCQHEQDRPRRKSTTGHLYVLAAEGLAARVLRRTWDLRHEQELYATLGEAVQERVYISRGEDKKKQLTSSKLS